MDAVTETSTLVTPEWMAAHADDPKVKLIEVAGLGQDEMPAYKAGHVPGAYGWKWKEMLWDPAMREFPTPENFAAMLGQNGIGNDTTVVFYGEGIQFGLYAWWAFRYCGHADVRVLDGGRDRWKAEGRPLSADIPKPPAPVTCKPVARREGMRIHRDAVLAALGDANTVILDARSPEEYSGQRVGGPGGPDVGAVRYGRIPGAKHLFYMDLFEADKRFKPGGALASLVAARGATPDHDIIAYCRMSHRATVVYFALTELLGYPRERVRVYDGSWTEWGNLVGVPVER
ncbi:MAG TPA: sulfurtransferase [Pseudolabrys sp.]|nr:sulfurtransferase [Pseudolabrys sp.]